ncbi:MAG: hypothetical protein KC996_01840 [Phycisphaerales bacterium]|nr:hypothetical protein [Phycisphaerales bacterium]
MQIHNTLSRNGFRRLAALAGFSVVLGVTGSAMAQQALSDPFIPPENPITEEKRVLGKILFWDEQLSSDNTVSCGTCHIATAGGSDPRDATHPGFDSLFNTPDDVSGSPGMISMDANEEYLRDVLFQLVPQSGNRVSFSNLMAAHAFNLFWDGRAEGPMIDPLTGQTAIPAIGFLEIQALGPILNPLEMAHNGRTWEQVMSKLEGARPLVLATDIPADVQPAIDANPTYADLFTAAFGDPAITPVRIAFALATYQRTTIPDQTPWDEFMAGNPTAMTPRQTQGWNAFQGSRCFFCHSSPRFTNNQFFADGVRDPDEDPGRFLVSGFAGDRGLFRSPSLRNVGLRDRLMHTGTLNNLDDVFDFYGHRNGFQPHPDNLDGRLVTPILFAPATETAIKDFLNNALTDPRVASGTFPFDRPTLYSETSVPNPFLMESTGRGGSGGWIPDPIAVTPPLIGSEVFKIGVQDGLGGAIAWVMYAPENTVINGELVGGELFGPFTLQGSGPGDGYATFKFPLPDEPRYDGVSKYFQWRVEDPNAVDGLALSPVVGVEMFCSVSGPCPDYCRADFTGDELIDIFDVFAYLDLFNAADELADLDMDGEFSIFDVFMFLDAYQLGCPA